jgi:hypothetical protein
MNDDMKITFRGLLEIFDGDGNLVRRQNNQIHPENISHAVALSLSNKSNGPIEKMVFGSGGAIVNGVGSITYLNKNVIGSSAELYNKTYEKIVDDNNTLNVDTSRNRIEVFHVDGNIFSDIMVTCTLELSEPNGQLFLDNTPSTEEDFVFDEIGLKSYDGKLLSHVIFSPIQKSANRVIVIKYTIRAQVC